MRSAERKSDGTVDVSAFFADMFCTKKITWTVVFSDLFSVANLFNVILNYLFLDCFYCWPAIVYVFC